ISGSCADGHRLASPLRQWIKLPFGRAAISTHFRSLKAANVFHCHVAAQTASRPRKLHSLDGCSATPRRSSYLRQAVSAVGGSTANDKTTGDPMSRERVSAICRTFAGAEVSDPWGGGHDARKVGGKMFACIGAITPGVSVKTDSIET